MSRLRKIIGISAVILLVAVQCAIFALTAQPADDTLELSHSVAVALKSEPVEELSATDATANTDADNLGVDTQNQDQAQAASSGKVSSPSLRQRLVKWALGIAEIRKWAHTAEFFPTGLLVAIAFLALGASRIRKRWLLLWSALTCVALSLFDQTHKLFVAARHFDVNDLAFDALGYITAILVVFAIYLIASRIHAGYAKGTGRLASSET